jgi:hypothetical protein
MKKTLIAAAKSVTLVLVAGTATLTVLPAVAQVSAGLLAAVVSNQSDPIGWGEPTLASSATSVTVAQATPQDPIGW